MSNNMRKCKKHTDVIVFAQLLAQREREGSLPGSYGAVK